MDSTSPGKAATKNLSYIIRGNFFETLEPSPGSMARGVADDVRLSVPDRSGGYWSAETEIVRSRTGRGIEDEQFATRDEEFRGNGRKRGTVKSHY